MSRWLTIALICLFTLLAAAACTQAAPDSEQPGPALQSSTPTFLPSPLPPTSTFTPTLTETPPPTATTTATPSATASATPSAAPSASPTAAPTQAGGGSLGIINAADPLRIYLIELSPGKGCNDNVVPVKINASRTKDVEADIETALKMLLGNKSEYWGSLYNPVFRSTLNVTNVELEGETAYIWLSGRYVPSKDKCDNSRVKAQIWSTIRQFREVTRPIIYLNQALLGDILSNDN